MVARKIGAKMEIINAGAGDRASGRGSDRKRDIHLLFVNHKEMMGRWVNAFEALCF